MKLLQMVLLVLFACQVIFSQTLYYVDAVGGSDTNPGTSQGTAWKNISKVNSFSFNPGDVVSFKCGSVWNEPLIIGRSGTQSLPITFSSYGTGAKPVIKNSSGGQWGNAVRITANYTVINGLKVSDAGQDGFLIEGNYNTVQNCEATNVGIGISVTGRNNLVTKNYIHHLHMVVNDPAPYNDFGAIAVGLFGSNNEVSYNRIDSCYAPSYDYGEDGGAIEFYGEVNSCYVHHNWALNTDGFCETGADPGTFPSFANNTLAYNVYVTTRGKLAFAFHVADQFKSNIQNLRIENNTFVSTTNSFWGMIWFDSAPSSTAIKFRNNIVYMDNGWQSVSSYGTFTHDHNLFYGNVGFSLGVGDLSANPRFVDVASHNFGLQSDSPAINAGTPLGYTSDFNNRALVGLPDIGAFEYTPATNADTPLLIGPPATATPVLLQNYPNPFNPTTTIQYELPADTFVTIELYDAIGRLIKTLVNERKSVGVHRVTFNANGLSSGMYMYRMIAGRYVSIRKCIVTK